MDDSAFHMQRNVLERKLEILGSVNLDILIFRDTLHYCLRCWKEVESRPRVGLADFLILCS
jgi:hypothetical protein